MNRTHGRRALRGVLFGVLFTLGAPGAARAEWVRIDTPNFVVFGESGERRVRDVAAEFERFREALGRVIPAAARPGAVPTVVVVFNTQASFKPYRPRYEGKTIDAAGYFWAWPDENLIALAIPDHEQALRTIFHEYTHLVVDAVARSLPAWLNEGLAEYYSTFAVSADGKEGTLGAVIPSHILRLNEEKLLSIDELLAVTHDSKMYNEGNRRSVFYAESWALVHMLFSGEPSRTTELAQYMLATLQGTPSVEAWKQAFGPGNLIKALESYMRQSRVRGFRYRFDHEIVTEKWTARKLPRAEVDAALSDILRRIGTAEAAGLLEPAAAVQPSSSLVQALLGLVRLEQGRREEAVASLLEAARDQSDWLVQYHVASGLVQVMHSGVTSEVQATQPALTKAIELVLSARPDLPQALFFRAQLSEATRQDLAEGLEAIRRARVLAPGRDVYAMLEASILTMRRDFLAARQVLGPLMTSAYPPQTRETARTMMGQIVAYELASASGSRSGSSDSQPPADASASPASAGDPSPPTATAVYRELQSGEERTEGLLERIECLASRIVLHVRTEARVVQFDAARFEDIEFITYRDDLKGSVSCGTRQPAERVYVTSRRAEGAAQPAARPRVIAVEFLPK